MVCQLIEIFVLAITQLGTKVSSGCLHLVLANTALKLCPEATKKFSDERERCHVQLRMQQRIMSHMEPISLALGMLLESC
jgi:hypothetical protein